MPAPTSPAGTRAPRPVAALIVLGAVLALVNVSMSSALLSVHLLTERRVIRAFRVTGLEPPCSCLPSMPTTHARRPAPLCSQALRRDLLRTTSPRQGSTTK